MSSAIGKNQISALREMVALAPDDEYRRVTEEEIAEILAAGEGGS